MSDDIVTEAARLIAPDWFGEPWLDMATGEEPALMKSKRLYKQAEARANASRVLKLALATPNLRERLVESEIDDWTALGIPVKGNAELERVVANKFAEPIS